MLKSSSRIHTSRRLARIGTPEDHRFELFSPSFYWQQYEDVREAGINLRQHYLNLGWKEGRSPHPLFDASRYLMLNPEVKEAQIEPTFHFLEYGWQEGRSPHILFDKDYYIENVSNESIKHVNPLVHYLTVGWKKGFKPHPLFDPSFYLAQNPDVATHGIEPFGHYLTYGWREGRSPHPLFDVQFYLRHQRDVFEAGLEPLWHYVSSGWSEGRQPHPLFVPQYYQSQHPQLNTCPLIDYILRGEREKWRPNPYFCPLFYVNNKKGDVFESPLEHYVLKGQRENRRPSPEFDPVYYSARYLGFEEQDEPLSHFLSIGRYHGFKPVPDSGPSERISSWVAWRRERENIAKLQNTGITPLSREQSDILYVMIGDSPNNLASCMQHAEIIRFSTSIGEASPVVYNLPAGATNSMVKAVLKENSADFVYFSQPDVFLSSYDLERLWLSALATRTSSSGVVPIFVDPGQICIAPADFSGMTRDWLNAGPLDADHPLVNSRQEFSSIAAPVQLLSRTAVQSALAERKDDLLFDLWSTPAALSAGKFGGVVSAPGSLARMPFGSRIETTSARISNQVKTRKILYVDSTVPRPNIDAGSDTAWRVLKLMNQMGFQVTFLPSVVADTDEGYIRKLQEIGVLVIYPPYLRDMKIFIEQSQQEYDVAFVARAPIAEYVLEPIRAKWPNCKVIFNTVDLHYVRMQREALLKSDANMFLQASEMKKKELGLIREADETIVLSEAEVDLLREEGIVSNVTVIPPIYDVGKSYPYVPAERLGVFFIGGFAHPPNVDAVEFLLAEVWPKVIEKRQDIPLYIAGSKMPEHFLAFESETIKLVGFVPDVDDFMRDKRLMVSPLRYGAGIKVKVIASISAGIPSVVTPMSIEGAGLTDGEGYIIAEKGEEIADAIVNAYDDLERLARISKLGRNAILARYSVEANMDIYKRILYSSSLD